MDAELDRRLERIERMTLLAAKNVFTVEDLALYLGKSPKTIRNTKDDYPHYYSETGKLFFRREEIERWQCRYRHIPAEAIITGGRI